MRKEVIYSLAALGLAPLAANAAVVNTVQTNKDAWQKSASSTSIAVNAETGVITISSGGEVTQELAKVVPGVYTLKFKSATPGLSIQILAKGSNSNTLLKEATLENEDTEIEFTNPASSTIIISVNKTGSYFFGGAELTLNFDFKAEAEALADALGEFKDNIKAYASDAAEGYDAQITELEKRIAAVLALETTGTDADRLNQFQALKLYNDIEGIGGTTPSDIMADILALKQNAFTAEKAYLQAELDKANAILNDPSLYDHAADAETTALRDNVAAAIAALEAGASTTAIQADLATLATKAAAAQTASDVIKAKWNTVKTVLDNLIPKYTELEDWSNKNLNETVDIVKFDGTNGTANKYAGLAAHLAREIAADKDSLTNYKPAIEAAYEAGTLFVLNEAGNAIDETKGLWGQREKLANGKMSSRIEYKTVYDKLAKALDETTAYEAVYGAYKTTLDTKYETFEASQAAYKQALVDGNGIVAADNAKRTAMNNAWKALYKKYYAATTGKKYKDDGTQDGWQNDKPWNTGYGFADILNGGIGTEVTNLGDRDNKAIKDFYAAGGDHMAYKEKYNAATTAYAKLANDYETLVKAWKETIKDDDAVKKGGFDPEKIWVAGAATSKYTKAYFAAQVKKQTDLIAKVNTWENYGKTENAAGKAALDGWKTTIAGIQAEVDEALKATKVGDVVTYSGLAVDTYNGKGVDAKGNWTFTSLYKQLTAAQSWADALDELLQKKGAADATNAYDLAYADADGIAFEGSEILAASYGDQMTGIKTALTEASDSLTALANGTQAKVYNGQQFVNGLKRIIQKLRNEGDFEVTKVDYSMNFISDNLMHFLGLTSIGSTTAVPTAISADARDIFTTHKLISNKLYNELKKYDQADAAATIKNIKAKEDLIKAGVKELVNKKEANGNVTNTELTADEAKVLYGPNAMEATLEAGGIITPAKALSTEKDELNSVLATPTEGILKETPFNTIKDKAVLTVADVDFDLQKVVAGKEPDTEDIDKYTAHLDNVLAQLKVIQSKAFAAQTAAAENEDFYKNGDGVTAVDGEVIAPIDIVNGALHQYYEADTTTIERNDYRQYPGVKAVFADKYAALKAAICSHPNPKAGIAKLEAAIKASYDKGTLKKDWEAEEGYAEQIATLHGQIDTLLIWANAAQAIYDAYMNAADAMADANIIKAATFNPTDKKLSFTDPQNDTEGKLLWTEVKTKIDALTNYDKEGENISSDGTAAKKFFDTTALNELLGLLWKEAPKGLVQKLDSAFTDLSAYINGTKFDNDFVNINEEQFKTQITAIKDALMGLEAVASANNEAYATQKKYAFGDVDENIKPVETLYYEVYTDIKNNDHTTAATGANGHLKKLEGLKALIDAQKGYNTKTTGWDQLAVKYKKGEASQALADSLVMIYDSICSIARTQAEGYDAAMAADNEIIHQQVLAEIVKAEEAYEKAVEVQESFAARSKELADAIDQAETERLKYNKDLKEQKDKLVSEKAKYTGNGAGSYNKWSDDNVGKSYATQGAIDKGNFTNIANKITNAMYEVVTAIQTKAVTSEAVIAKVKDADSVRLCNEWAKNFLLENTDEAKEANKKMRENVNTGFGYIHYFDKDGKPSDTKKSDGTEERAGYLKLAYDLLDAKQATEFSLKALDEALAAIPADFKENTWSRYNAMADNVLTPLKNKAAGVFADGEAAYGEDTDATEEEKEAWATAALLYTDTKNETGAKDLYDAANAATLHKNQIGGTDETTKLTFVTVKEAFETFLAPANNPYVKATNAAEAQAKAALMATSLLKRLAAQKAVIAKYGANGDMQARINLVEDMIDNFLNSATSTNLKADSTAIDNAIIDLAPNQLALEEYNFIEDQIKAVKQQYNTLEASGDANAAAAKAAVAVLEEKLGEQKTRLDLYKNPGDKPVLPAQKKDEKPEDYAKVVEKYNKDVATREYKLARMQAACDSLLAMEGIVAADLTTYANLAGVTNDSIVEVLQTAIDLAQDKADAAKATIADNANLSADQKEDFNDEIEEAEKLLADAKKALDKAKTDGNAIVKQNAIQQLIDAAESEIATTLTDVAATTGDNAASNAAAKAMLEGPADATYFTYTVKALEDAVKDIEDELAKEDGKYTHADEADYGYALGKIKANIAALREEVEEAKEAYTADKYMKKKDSDYLFKKKGDKINTAIQSLTQLIEESEIDGFIEDLAEQIAELDDAITPDKYNAKDYAALQKELQAIKDAMYKEGITTMPWIPATPTGLVVDAEKLNDGTTGEKTLLQLVGTDADGLAAGTAKGIQNAIDALEEEAEAKAIIAPNPDEIIPGDLDGNGVVDDGDYDAFESFLLNTPKSELPQPGDDDFELYDVNGDGKIDVADAMAVYNLSAGLNWDGSQPGSAAARSAEAPAGNLTAETSDLGNGMHRITLNLDSNFDYVAFQMEVQGAEVQAENAEGMRLRTANVNGAHRILAFGSKGNGQVITLDVQGNAQLGTITFATANAQSISFKLNATTGIYGISADKAATTYDLSGKLLNGMKKGVNIIRDAAGKVKKAIMK